STKNTKYFSFVTSAGPCGGKTSGLAVLTQFFEQAGWKVYRVPETNAILMNVGVKFGELKGADSKKFLFQTNIMRTTMRLEKTFFDLSNTSSVPCLVLCDGGVMDIAAHISHDTWEQLKMDNHWHEVYLRDRRYDQIIHLVTSAKGASTFYQAQHNPILESIDQAISLDDRIADAWLGHPYYYIIDNSTNFEKKMLRTLAAVCLRVGVPFSDGNLNDVKKQKFLVDSLGNMLVNYQEFICVYNILTTGKPHVHARVKKQGQNGYWTFIHSVEHVPHHQESDFSTRISATEYKLLLLLKDPEYSELCVKSRYFLWKDLYFRLDIFEENNPSRLSKFDTCFGK
ncbi:hypothetical protein HELRODRAFT_62277, partial [Helobdella robusta]|uniref:NadR/Ttd14 AAA domain-containing protein n=1 Tax=Helobdella robusta TaxID=6412 RepID=T1FWY4_HELRO